MKRLTIVSAWSVAALLGSLAFALPGPARAANGHEARTFLIGTVDGTAYAPKAVGTIRSAGVSGGRLTFFVHLSGMPQPGTLGGRLYKVWLVAPQAAVALPGGALTYNADGTADGAFTSAYHDFTVLAITPETVANGATPQGDKVLEGSIDVGGLQAALLSSAPQLAMTQGHLTASSFGRLRVHSSAPSGQAAHGAGGPRAVVQ